MSDRVDSRIDLRLPRETKELIEYAASIEGISTSAFVIGNALYGAKEVIAQHQQWTLSREDSRAFVDAVTSQTHQPIADSISALKDKGDE